MAIQDSMIAFYSSACPLPLMFLVYVILHIVRHRKDGIQHGRVQFSKGQRTKRVLSGILAFSSFLNSVDGFTVLQKNTSVNAIRVRTAFFTVQMIAWVMNCVLVPFDYNRRLHSPWYSQRSFMPLCVCVYISLCFLEGFSMKEDDWNYNFEIATLTLYCLNAVVTATLTCIFCIRPDDFVKVPRQYSSFYRIPPVRSDSVLTEEVEISKVLKVEIYDFKTKMRADKTPVVYYNITVNTSHSVSTVKRTYGDFVELNSSLVKNFHWLKLPDFPKYETNRDSVTMRMSHLTDYMKSICQPEVICDVLLDFFAIDEPQRSSILDWSRQVLENKASTSRTNEELVLGIEGPSYSSLLSGADA